MTAKQPRDPESGPRTSVKVWLTADEVAWLDERRRVGARPVSRSAVVGDLVRLGQTPAAARCRPEETDRLLAELVGCRTPLSRVGNNLNQIARVANATSVVPAQQLADTLERLGALLDGVGPAIAAVKASRGRR